MPGCWEIRLTVADQAEVFAEVIAAACGAETMSFHREGKGEDWLVSVIAEAEPADARVTRAVDEAIGITGITPTSRSMRAVPAKDWLEENRKSFPPLNVASFHIYGSGAETPRPENRIGLLLNAGQAFGSGMHASTQGCIVMLEKHLGGLDGDPLRVADIGCGSGILAMAVAKLRPDARIIAVDNDPVAVRVAADNAENNDIASSIAFGVSDGYEAALVRDNAPFDLILANILPSPLIEMAPRAAACLAPSGALVVSGMMEAQCEKVAARHEAEGLALRDRFSLDDWATLVFGCAEEDA